MLAHQIPQRVLVHFNSRTVVMEVEIRMTRVTDTYSFPLVADMCLVLEQGPTVEGPYVETTSYRIIMWTLHFMSCGLCLSSTRLCPCQCRRGTSGSFRAVERFAPCRVLCAEVDDGIPVEACSSHDASAPLSQKLRDVDFSCQMRSNKVLPQLSLTVPAGHTGALVGRRGADKHRLSRGSRPRTWLWSSHGHYTRRHHGG